MGVTLRDVAGVGVNRRDDLCYGFRLATTPTTTTRDGMAVMNLSSRIFSSFLLVLAILVPGPEAGAEEPRSLGTFRDWSAFGYNDGDTLVCFIASQPTKAEGNYTQRGDIWILVTHRSPAGERDVVQVRTGYNYMENAPVAVTIGNETFTLFGEGESAWAFTRHDDRDLVTAMKAGVQMVIEGRSWRGTVTTDTYSLLGFTAAYEAISQTCAE